MSLKNRVRRLLRRGSAWEPGLVLEAPEPEAGEVLGPPDFVGVGAQKAGTTWWFANLLQHPDVRGPAKGRKELHFFNRLLLDQGEPEHYHRWFPRREGQVCGEWTPAYMSQPWTPALLHQVAPEAKILVMLRDPLQRLISGLTHAAARGRILDPETVGDAVHRSCYSPQLERLFEAVGREQVWVLQFEQCRADPQALFDQTTDFLGLDRHPLERTDPKNQTKTERVELHPSVLAALRPQLTADAQRTAELVPIDLSLWPSAGAP